MDVKGMGAEETEKPYGGGNLCGRDICTWNRRSSARSHWLEVSKMSWCQGYGRRKTSVVEIPAHRSQIMYEPGSGMWLEMPCMRCMRAL